MTPGTCFYNQYLKPKLRFEWILLISLDAYKMDCFKSELFDHTKTNFETSFAIK